MKNFNKLMNKQKILIQSKCIFKESRLQRFLFRALQRVQILVHEYETIKKQESEKRALYKNEKNQLDEEINQLDQRLQTTEIPDIDPEKVQQIEEQYQLVSDRLQKQKLIFVKKIQIKIV